MLRRPEPDHQPQFPNPSSNYWLPELVSFKVPGCYYACQRRIDSARKVWTRSSATKAVDGILEVVLMFTALEGIPVRHKSPFYAVHVTRMPLEERAMNNRPGC
jgi:hypothetical protein